MGLTEDSEVLASYYRIQESDNLELLLSKVQFIDSVSLYCDFIESTYWVAEDRYLLDFLIEGFTELGLYPYVESDEPNSLFISPEDFNRVEFNTRKFVQAYRLVEDCIEAYTTEGMPWT